MLADPLPMGPRISASNGATNSSRRKSRITEFAPALAPAQDAAAPASGYASAEVASPFKAGRFVFARLCVARLLAHCAALPARGSLRPKSAQKLMAVCGWFMPLASASAAPVRGSEQCQWHGRATAKPRRVSVRLASSQRRFATPPLAGLEPADPSPGLQAVTRSPTGADPAAPTRTSSASHECAPAHASRSGPIIASRGQSDWRAMRVHQPQA